MSEERLAVALVGAGGFGARTLEALQQSDRIRIVGVADKDAAVAEQAGQSAGVPAFTDNRSLLAETRPQAAFLAVPPMAAADLVAACAEREIHVWKELPLARNLTEGVAMVRRMDGAGLKLAVGTQRRFAPGYRRAAQLQHRLGEIFLARAHYLFNWGAELNWRADRNSAGGGALLELGYHPIDLLISMLGCPEEVYGLSTVSSGGVRVDDDDPPQPVHDTDDTAAAVLRYRTGLMATVVTTRSSGPVGEELALHGRKGSLTATAETCLLRDPDGAVLDHLEDRGAPAAAFARQVEGFADAVTGPSTQYECSGWENLFNLAVVEAVYLSDRTAQPENLQDLLKTHGISADDCLRHRPGREPNDDDDMHAES